MNNKQLTLFALCVVVATTQTKQHELDETEITLATDTVYAFKTDDSRVRNTKFDVKEYVLEYEDYPSTEANKVRLFPAEYHLAISKHAPSGTVKVLGVNARGDVMTTTVVHIRHSKNHEKVKETKDSLEQELENSR